MNKPQRKEKGNLMSKIKLSFRTQSTCKRGCFAVSGFWHLFQTQCSQEHADGVKVGPETPGGLHVQTRPEQDCSSLFQKWKPKAAPGSKDFPLTNDREVFTS